MKPTDQTLFEEGKGNCFSACIASLMEMPLEKVYHHPDGICDDWLEYLNSWLAPFGLFYLQAQFGSELQQLTPSMGFHIIAGPCNRSKEPHAVIGFQGEIYFDPHPSRDGLLEDKRDWVFGFLVPQEIRYIFKQTSIPSNCNHMSIRIGSVATLQTCYGGRCNTVGKDKTPHFETQEQAREAGWYYTDDRRLLPTPGYICPDCLKGKG